MKADVQCLKPRTFGMRQRRHQAKTGAPTATLHAVFSEDQLLGFDVYCAGRCVGFVSWGDEMNAALKEGGYT